MTSIHGEEAGDIPNANGSDPPMNGAFFENGGADAGDIDGMKSKVNHGEATDKNKRKLLANANVPVPRATKRQRCNVASEEKEIEIVPSPSTTLVKAPATVYPPPSGRCTCTPTGPLHACRANSKEPFSEGDVIIVQERYNRLFQLKLVRGSHINTRYGRYHHDDLIGRTAGIRWLARQHSTTGSTSCAGFMHVLRMGPKCWGNSISHKTQIVHGQDASIIISRLHLHSGCKVLEAGVGSGALTAQIAWAVYPHGSIRSFDFHEDRAHAARDILGNNIVPKLPISVSVGDVVVNGFPGVADASVDAVFLDLPMPEKCVAEAYRALVDGGRVCCFSPCMEQVERTRKAMRASRGWHSVETITAPIRQFDTKLKIHPDEDVAEVRAAAEKHHFGRIVRPNRGIVSKPFREMKSHTSYLTFATRIPRSSEKLRDLDKALNRGNEAVDKSRRTSEAGATNAACVLF